MAKGSVITTHLLDGDPQGIRRVFIKNKTCEMYIIPRTLLSDAKAMKAINLKQPGLYMLLENLNSRVDELPKAYIGHAEDVGVRLDQHSVDNNNNKDFFQIVLVFVSADHSINKADVQYLEYKAIKAAKEATRYDMTPNSQNGTLPHLSPDQEDVIDEFREFVWLLTSFAGCRIFQPSPSSIPLKSQNVPPIFFLKYAGIVAKAIYDSEEMVILKDSEIRKETVKSAKPKRRETYLKDKIIAYCKDAGDRYIVKQDVSIPSPSTAAWVVSGTGLNGWDKWITSDGKTLDDVYRKDK